MVTGLISRWWAGQHGKQLGYAATASGATGLLFLMAITQLLFLQSDPSWKDYTGHAIGLAAISSVLFLIILPEFLTLRGHALLLEELKELESTSEIRRRKATNLLMHSVLATLLHGRHSLKARDSDGEAEGNRFVEPRTA